MAGWRISLWATIVVVALLFLYLVRSVLLPFIIAILVSILLDPAIRKLRIRGYPRPVAVSIVFVVFFGFLTALGIWLAPTIGQQLGNVRTNLENLGRQFAEVEPRQNYYLRWNPAYVALGPAKPNPVDQILTDLAPTLERVGLPSTRKELVEKYVTPNQKEIGQRIQHFFAGFLGIASSAVSQIMFLLLTPLLIFMILVDLERLKRRGASWIPPSIRAETVQMLGDIGQVFVKYIQGVTNAVLLYMAGSAVVLTLLGAPYSILLGILFGAIYLIPYIGPLISWAVLFFVVGLSGKDNVLFFQLSSPWAAATVLVVIFLVFDRGFDTFVFPRIMGKAVGLHPVVSMFVIFSGAALFGLVGMIIAFPLAGAVKVVLDRLIRVTSTPAEGLDLPAVPLRHRGAV
ncbi:MAG TPA: AI-2E family transporter [Fimbriimonadaceae bacterium]|nr:AI-2E family transporter [Fimbriimonadaceae bacterium]